MQHPFIGQTIGRWQLDAEIGRGGTGTVYRARPLDGGPAVAIKLLRPGPDLKRHMGRLRREVEVARRLQHPGAVPILDFGFDGDGRPYLVSELLVGETLRELLAREGALSPLRVRSIASDVLPVLAEAHRLGLVHRDLKPENLFSTADGVRVLDFGLVRPMTATDSFGQITRTGMVGGTPRYVSPENAQGLPVDGRADLYSFGVVLYELLAGRPPFTAETPIELLLRHLNDPVPSLTSPLGPLPGPLAALVYQCLEKRPERRPESADGLLDALNALALPLESAQLSGPAARATSIEVFETASDELPVVAPAERSPRDQLAEARTVVLDVEQARESVEAILSARSSTTPISEARTIAVEQLMELPVSAEASSNPARSESRTESETLPEILNETGGGKRSWGWPIAGAMVVIGVVGLVWWLW